MPRHLLIAAEIFRRAGVISRADKKYWDKLYFGIRRDINLGIRHGLAAGSAIGSLIPDEGKGPYGGSQLSTPSKPDQTRKRYSTSTTGKRKFKRTNRTGRRCSCASKYRRGVYRKRSSRVFRNSRSRRYSYR